jgi:hypothetical protein
MQQLGSTINVTNTLDFISLTLDDSEDAVGQTALMSDDGTTGTVTSLSPALIHYTDFDISSLTVLGGSGGNFFTVEGTLVNTDFPSTLTTLNEGPGVHNTVDVFATSAGSMLDIVGSGGPDFVTSPDFVTIGDGSMGFLHAMDWQVVIIERWLANNVNGSSRSTSPTVVRDSIELGNPDDHAAEMFVGIAQRVAADVDRGSFSAPEDD